MQRIIDEVRPGTIASAQQIPTYAHLDFTWGVDAHQLVYANVVQLLQKYNPL